MGGCNFDESQVSKPLPWVGLYIVAGSSLCAILMALDIINGIRQHKLWFPCKYFALNAATITFLGVATKLPVDLNTIMPSHMDQLSKLSGTVLICIVTANVMPSLGSMDSSSLVSNVISLGILVITVIVNMSIQMGTGVIFAFFPEHVIVMVLMMVLLTITISTAIAVPNFRHKVDSHGDTFQNNFLKKRADQTSFKQVMGTTWLVARLGDHQYVIGRSATCVASGAFCLLSSLILIEATARSFMSSKSMFCTGESDYKWSSTFIFVAQLFATVAGTIAPTFRWLNVTRFWKSRNWCKDILFAEEQYRSVLQVGWFSIVDRVACSKLKGCIYLVLLHMHLVVVIICKLVRLVTYLPVTICCHLKKKENHTQVDEEARGSYLPDVLAGLFRRLDEFESYELLTKPAVNELLRLVERARKKQQQNQNQLHILINMIREYHPCTKVGGNLPEIVHQFSRELARNQSTQVLVVSLAATARLLPEIDHDLFQSLLKGISEGMRYVIFIEEQVGAGRQWVRFLDDTDNWTKSIELLREMLSEFVPNNNRQESSTYKVEYLHQLFAGGESTNKGVVERLALVGKSEQNRWETIKLMKEIASFILIHEGILLQSPNNLLLWIQMTVTHLICDCLHKFLDVVCQEWSSNGIDNLDEIMRSILSYVWESEELWDCLLL